MTPLKATWPKIYPPLVEHLKLQVRMNVKSRAVELRTSKHTTDSGALQKGDDFVRAFSLGFDVDGKVSPELPDPRANLLHTRCYCALAIG